MKRVEIMLFTERLLLAEALTKYRKQEVLKIGWLIKDEERLKKYYMDCIGLLVGLGIIDIAKSRQFIIDMGAEENGNNI